MRSQCSHYYTMYIKYKRCLYKNTKELYLFTYKQSAIAYLSLKHTCTQIFQSRVDGIRLRIMRQSIFGHLARHRLPSINDKAIVKGREKFSLKPSMLVVCIKTRVVVYKQVQIIPYIFNTIQLIARRNLYIARASSFSAKNHFKLINFFYRF